MTRDLRGPGPRRPGRRTFVALRFALLLAGGALLLAEDLPAQDATIPAPAAGAPSGTATAATADPQSRRRRRRTTRRSRRRVAEPPIPRATTPTSAGALSNDVGVMLGGGTRSGRWGVMIVSLTRGDTLYQRGADELLQPASTMKLMTAALALENFGPEHQFTTEVFRDGALDSSGAVNGSLYLRGAGDPGFSNRFLRGDPEAPVDLLARLVAGGAGVKRVRGDLVADASAFEPRKIPEGWQSRYLGLGYAAPVSALSLNENTVWVVVEPGMAGAPAIVRFEPSSSGITLGNRVRTVKGSRGASLAIRRAGNGAVEARGWIGSRSSARRYELVVDEPALFTAGALRDALTAQGVTVEGAVRLGATPGNAVSIAGLPSPPLSRLIAVMNRESVNHFGELLFRNAARAGAGEGSAVAGNRLLRHFAAQKLGVDSTDVYAADGSGLSVLDRVTPRAMVHLLDYAHRAPWSASFHASLPVAGESELLRHRMRATPAQGNLHAKTGTTNTVISLAGYVTALDGEVIAFAFIYNGNDRARARATIDQMGATLAGFVRE
ncbi:MAG TPA: D-alanyl-D-alanine carboxypeptidase/D-alanyl-D-alanine-endopeptidase [Gemmatimonadaceae bacterium]|nr:D-alanyl-D-alanine carboxypeptidase/D-alanyl-D-alanine-endopeptidase [Gemmatimonadaceae bacterium]